MVVITAPQPHLLGRTCAARGHPTCAEDPTVSERLVMPVYYSAISRGRIVVCDYSTVKVQLESYALRALELLGPSDEQRRQEIDGRLIFTLVLGKLTYLAITDMDYPRVS